MLKRVSIGLAILAGGAAGCGNTGSTCITMPPTSAFSVRASGDPYGLVNVEVTYAPGQLSGLPDLLTWGTVTGVHGATLQAQMAVKKDIENVQLQVQQPAQDVTFNLPVLCGPDDSVATGNVAITVHVGQGAETDPPDSGFPADAGPIDSSQAFPVETSAVANKRL